DVRYLPILFFFQAEDGIRAFHVTGVQTCALPICPLMTSRVELVDTFLEVDRIRLVPDQGMLVDESTVYPVYIDPSVSASRPNRRSEERRVGKEGRPRRSAYH